jgi:hypothetical protein
MKGNNQSKIFSLISKSAAIILGSIFLLASFSKIGNLPEFEGALQSVSVFPQWVKGLTILFLPGMELALGLCLLSRIAIREAGLIATILLMAFLVFGIYSTLNGSASGCHCFKLAVPEWLKLNGWWVVFRNILFLCLSLIVTFKGKLDERNFLHL